MNKIICLIDYTRKSENALQYAANLALDTSSKLILVSLQHQRARRRALIFVGEGEQEYHPSRLSEMCDQLRSMWKIRCDFSEVSSLNMEELAAQLGPDIQLMVVGIESSTRPSPYKDLSAIDFKMIRESSIPIVLVPENFEYHRVTRMLYAYDYRNDASAPVEQLRHLSDWLKSDIRVLTVAQKEYSPEEDERIEKRIDQFRQQWTGVRNISFDYIYYEDVAKCLDHYVDLWRKDDMMVFSIGPVPLTKRLFHKSIIKEITLCCDYPVMILHRN
jgi:hypothetical protein